MMWFKLNGDYRLLRCTSEGCGGQQTWRLEADGIGSNYCSGCKEKIEQRAAANDFPPGSEGYGKLVQS